MIIDSTPGNGIEDNTPGISEAEADAIGALFMNDDEESEKTTPTEVKNDAENEEPIEAQPDKDDADEQDADVDDQEEEAETQDTDDDQVFDLTNPDAKVTLPDGSTTTVHELVRGNLREKDYTQKRQMDAENARTKAREELQTEIDRVNGLEQTLAKEREQMAMALNHFVPKPPNREDYRDDPVGLMWAKDDYDEAVLAFKQAMQGQQQAQERQQQEQQAAYEKHIADERSKMLEAMPELRDPEKLDTFTKDFTKTLTAEYGFSQEDINTVTDHRILAVVRDAMEYRKLKAEAPKAVERTKDKPPVMKPQRKKSAQSAANAAVEERIARAQKSGRIEGVTDILGQLLTS